MGSAAFLLQKPQAFGTHRGSATSLFTMSDDAAATAPAAAVPAGAAPLTRGQDQLPALRAARAVLKQQLKESTKEIRILVGDMKEIRKSQMFRPCHFTLGVENRFWSQIL